MKYELRADGALHIEGYVNAVERDSKTVVCPECGKCVEQIQAGAFGEALRAADNVDLLLNHNRSRRLGSTAEGNLSLYEDNIGLRAAADITDSEVIEKARHGLLRGWSFGFKALKTDIEQRAKSVPRRHVKSLAIFEVSLIDDTKQPCYAGTSIEMRGGDGETVIETREFSEGISPAELEKQYKKLLRWRDITKRCVYHGLAKPQLFFKACEEVRAFEIRYNPYHDPSTGRFTDASGGSSGGVLYVGQGEKGNGQYVYNKAVPKEPNSDKKDQAYDGNWGNKAATAMERYYEDIQKVVQYNLTEKEKQEAYDKLCEFTTGKLDAVMQANHTTGNEARNNADKSTSIDLEQKIYMKKVKAISDANSGNPEELNKILKKEAEAEEYKAWNAARKAQSKQYIKSGAWARDQAEYEEAEKKALESNALAFESKGRVYYRFSTGEKFLFSSTKDEYQRKAGAEIHRAYEDEEIRENKYHDPKTGKFCTAEEVGNGKSRLTDEEKRDILIKKLQNGKLSSKLDKGKQAPHRKNSVEYNQRIANGEHPSYVTVSNMELQNIINQYSTKGEIHTDKNCTVFRETITVATNFGVYVEHYTGNEYVTNRGTIHYSKSGVHIIPSSPNPKTN